MNKKNYLKFLSVISILTILFSQLPIIKVSAATTRNVNQIYGPYYTIVSALNASNTGDTIEITDSKVYYESFIIGTGGRDISNLTIKGVEGQQPIISGEGKTGSLIQIKNSGCMLQNLTVYSGGVTYGVDITGSGNTLEGVAFDNHLAPNGNTFAVNLTQSTTIKGCNFLGSTSVNCGGILANSTTAITLTISRCDFYDIGTVGGMVGMGLATGSTATISQSIFGATNTSNTIYALNSWGSGTITEYENGFRNIYVRISGFNSNTPHGSDSVTTGSVYPSDSSVQLTDSSLNALLTRLGASNAYSFSYPDSTTLGSWLNKTVLSNNFDTFDNQYYDDAIGISLKQNTLEFMNYTKPKMWFNFSITWGRQLDPSEFARVKRLAAETRQQSNLADINLSGYLMEAIEKTNIENTPISNDLWCWYALWYPNVSYRPLEAKTVNGIRRQGRFFDYETMLGFGVNHWGTDVSVPNLNKQEALLYYIFAAKGYIEAGLNDIQLAQPQLTFGQALSQYGYGGTNLQYISRFIRNYGNTYGPLLNGNRWATCGVATIVKYLKSYVNYNDYLLCSAGTDSIGTGVTWNTLNDSYNTMPPANIFVTGKPVIANLDNCSLQNDQISVFAATAPATRNSWAVNFTASLLANRGFYLAQPAITPVYWNCQSFTGYTNADTDYPFRSYFQPFQEVSGFENTVKGIFDSH